MTHPELVKALKKPGDQILQSLTPKKVDLLKIIFNDFVAYNGVFDHIKKHVIYNKDLNINIDDHINDDDGKEILKTLDAEKASLLHMAMLIFGEAGEILEAIKNHVIDNEPLDIENVIEEIGDLKFGIEGLIQDLNLTHEVCIESNIKKLSIRYGDSYSDEAAQNRKDKEDGFKFLTES